MFRNYRTLSRESANQARFLRNEWGLGCSSQGLLGRGIIVLLLLPLFVFRQLLLLVLFLVFLATLVAHACSSFKRNLDSLRV